MTKQELQTVVRELKSGVQYDGVNIEPLHGLGCSDFLGDFTGKKVVSKEVIVQFLRYQCCCLNGLFDEVELSNDLELLKRKVMMV